MPARAWIVCSSCRHSFPLSSAVVAPPFAIGIDRAGLLPAMRAFSPDDRWRTVAIAGAAVLGATAYGHSMSALGFFAFYLFLGFATIAVLVPTRRMWRDHWEVTVTAAAAYFGVGLLRFLTGGPGKTFGGMVVVMLGGAGLCFLRTKNLRANTGASLGDSDGIDFDGPGVGGGDFGGGGDSGGGSDAGGGGSDF